ncbi:PREDICTED: indoleamine 2,3-dioxygenase 2-like [Acropora digitifera]|uniref:indoleamine 2,3-dioxygenase 2-like n=1 Tax=Acropora digitifera TaxID=70779 RepID=UPI00077B1F64|nr:PREDICTED: indoleamine 2,3-dioxygenase 2-like [Acropora digitifera]
MCGYYLCSSYVRIKKRQWPPGLIKSSQSHRTHPTLLIRKVDQADMASVPSPVEFDVSPVVGFVPEKEPLQCLPEYFSPWEELASNLPNLVKSPGILHQRINELPLLDHCNLSSEDEWKRAHLVLSCISHAYVWCKGETGVAKVLPKCLAVPWVAVANYLSIPPIITHCSFALYNWKYIDPSKPLSMDNMEVAVMMTGSSTEKGFIKIPIVMELEFGRKGLHAIIDGQKSVKNAGDTAGVMEALKLIKATVTRLTEILLQTNDVVDPNEFYHNLRKYFSGWDGNPNLPHGLIYEGVSETPLKYSGGSTAESAIFQVLDAALGVTHVKNADSKAEDSFLKRMRYYMPPKHRAFIEAVEQGPSIRNFGKIVAIAAV